MPKSIDSIGRKPEKKQADPLVKHEAGEVFRPRGEGLHAGEQVKPKGYVNPKTQEPKAHVYTGGEKPKQDNLTKRLQNLDAARNKKTLLAVLAIGVVGVVALAAFIFSWSRIRGIVRQPSSSNYAEIDGKVASKQEFEEIRTAYIAFDQKNGQNDAKQSERRAADEIITRLALEAQADKNGVTVTDNDIDAYLKPSYSKFGSLGGLYDYNKQQYGWSEVPLRHKAKLEVLKQKLDDKLIAKVDILGAYIRWDNVRDKPEDFRKDYETKAIQRLNQEYKTVLERGASRDAFVKTTDINEFLPADVNATRLNAIETPNVRYLELKNISNDPDNDQFDHYKDEGESAWKYIDQLSQVGQTTTVFKSDSGMYMVLRLERKTNGAYVSYKQILDQAVKNGKVSASYFALPAAAQDKPKTEPGPTPNTNPVSSVLNSILPKAYASGSYDCWKDHPLYYTFRPTDLTTLAPITGKTFSVLVVRSGKDICIPYSGFGYFINGDGRQAWAANSVVYNTELKLNCYGVVWDFAWSPPAGYQPFSPADYQAPNRILTGSTSTGLQWSPSDKPGIWEKSSIYYGIANGAGRYAIAPLFEPVPPPPRPKVTFQGFKVNEALDGTGAYKDGVMRIDGSASYTTDNAGNSNPAAQPYFIRSILADQDHVIRPDDVPGFDVVGYKLGNNPITYGPRDYAYRANQVGDGGVIDLWWIYRPKFTADLSVTCGTITSTVSGPSGFTATISIAGNVLKTTTQSNDSVAVPDQYRDGVKRKVDLKITYAGKEFVAVSKDHRCNSDAACDAADFSQMGNATDAGSSYTVVVRMKNTGQSIWKDYADNNSYRLSQSDGEGNYEATSDNLNMPAGTVVKPVPDANSTVSFTVSVKAKNSVGAPDNRLAFRMLRVDPVDGSTQFGAECSAAVPVRAIYGPWLRTQNGAVAAFNKILAQPEEKRGGRNVADTAGRNINRDATYAVMSRTSVQNRFCSSNAYLYGRQNDDVASCDFDNYFFNLKSSIEAVLNSGSKTVDGLFERVATERQNSPVSCNGDALYEQGPIIANLSGGNLSPSPKSCPRIFLMASGGALSNGNINISQGRGTVLVDGDLIIDHNITNTPNTISYDEGTLDALNKVPNLGLIVKGDIIITNSVSEIQASMYASGRIITCDRYTDRTVYSDPVLNGTTGYKDPSNSVQLNQAQACTNPLVVKGMMVAKGGFTLGRNFVDFNAIRTRVNKSASDPAFDYAAPDSKYYGKPAEDVIFNGLLLYAPPPGFEDLAGVRSSQVQYLPNNFLPRF